MLVLDAEIIRALATPERLIEALRGTFSAGTVETKRTPTSLPGGSEDRLFVSMLAMEPGGPSAIKLLTILPENPARGRLTVQGAIVLFAETGEPVAVLDGTVVTHLRTGAASALASQFLSRGDSTRLVVAGTGALAPTMGASHCAVRPIRHVAVWGRDAAKAKATADAIGRLVPYEIEVEVAEDLETAVRAADIVSCSTSSPTPILKGEWLRPGTHVDLVGSFQPTKRESDDEVVRRARIFVDTFKGALHEGGDVVDPLARGVITRDRIEGELTDLTRGTVKGRRTPSEVTMFKSVGTAIEDLAAARMIVEAAQVAA